LRRQGKKQTTGKPSRDKDTSPKNNSPPAFNPAHLTLITTRKEQEKQRKKKLKKKEKQKSSRQT
jgi:hypothetical protein